MEFLGYIVKTGGFAMAQDKVEAITAWPVPKCRKDVRSFLGLANYCRDFIQNFSQITLPLTCLCSDKVQFIWTDKCPSAFVTLKEAFTSALVLAMPDPAKPFVLETDASNLAVGGVLLQEGGDGMLHPVAYYSKKMLPAEGNYPIYNKEMLAIMKTLKHWCRYLCGAEHPVKVLTDHKNLVYFFKPYQLNQRQARWALELADYTLTID